VPPGTRSQGWVSAPDTNQENSIDYLTGFRVSESRLRGFRRLLVPDDPVSESVAALPIN
jgi:hypothetical protein